MKWPEMSNHNYTEVETFQITVLSDDKMRMLGLCLGCLSICI